MNSAQLEQHFSFLATSQDTSIWYVGTPTEMLKYVWVRLEVLMEKEMLCFIKLFH